MDEYVASKLRKLDAKIEHMRLIKRKKNTDANHELTITLDKGDIKTLVHYVEDNKLEKIDNEDGDTVFSIKFEHIDETAEHDFYKAYVTFILSIVSNGETNLHFEPSVYGHYEDVFGNDVKMTELMRNNNYEAKDLTDAIKWLQKKIEEVDPKYLGPSADKLYEVLDNCMC